MYFKAFAEVMLKLSYTISYLSCYAEPREFVLGKIYQAEHFQAALYGGWQEVKYTL